MSLGGTQWFVHFTVEVTAHCVDALTGVDGTETERYLEEHWQYPEFLALEPGALPDVV